MAGTKYTVEIEYVTKGNIFGGSTRAGGALAGASREAAGLRRIQAQSLRDEQRGMERHLQLNEQLRQRKVAMMSAGNARGGGLGIGGIGGMMSGLGGGISGAADSAAGAALGIGAKVAGTLAAGAFAAVTYGIVAMNAEIEETTIGLAGIFQAQGQTKTGWQGFNDAMDLGAGQLKEMRKDAAALPGEFKDLVNVFRTIAIPGLHAGLNPTELRQFSAKTMAIAATTGLPMHVAAREMAGLLEGRSGAHNMLGQRLLGLSGGKATAFNHKTEAERYKMLNDEMNKYQHAFNAYQNSFAGLKTTFTDYAKMFLATATAEPFERVKAALRDMNAWFGGGNGTRAETMAQNIGHALAAGFDYALHEFHKVRDEIMRFAEWSKTHSIKDKAVGIAKSGLGMYAGAKIAGTGLQMAGGAMSMMGSGGALAGLGSAGAMGTAAALAAPAVAALMVATVSLGFALEAAADKTSTWHKAALTATDDMTVAFSELTNGLAASLAGLGPIFKDQFTTIGIQLIQGITAGMKIAGFLWAPAAAMARDIGNDYDKYVVQPRGGVQEEYKKSAGSQYMWDSTEILDKAFKNGKKNLEHDLKPPNHTTHIHRVEINLSSNADPSRIARMTVDELTNLARHPTSARYSKNYGAIKQI